MYLGVRIEIHQSLMQVCMYEDRRKDQEEIHQILLGMLSLPPHHGISAAFNFYFTLSCIFQMGFNYMRQEVLSTEIRQSMGGKR